MKILHVCLLTPNPDARSGAGVVISGQFQATRDQHDYSLILLAPTSREEAQAQQELRAQGVDVHVLHGRMPRTLVRWKRAVQDAIGRSRGWPAMGAPRVIDPSLVRLVNKLIDRGAYDLIQIENIGLPRLPTDRRLPSLVVEHEVHASDHASGAGGAAQATLWRQADRLQVYTRRDASAILDQFPEAAGRLRINPFGVSLPQQPALATQPSVKRNTITFVGNFNHTPNVDAAVWLCEKIIPTVHAVAPDATLRIVGQDPPPRVRGYSSATIAVLGRVPAVEPLLAESAVNVVPVRHGGGMRVKTLQALASGRPVVSTRLGVEGLYGEQVDWPVLLADDAAAFTGAIVHLLKHPGEADRLGERGRAFVAEHHTWTAYARRLNAIYDELAGAPIGGAA